MDEQDQALLISILKNAVDAIIVIDRWGNIRSANSATRRMFGYSPEELRGQNVKLLMPSPYFEAHDEYLENYHRTGQAKIIGVGREVSGKRRDGSIFPMHLAVNRFVVGDEVFFAGIVRDITDLKETQKKLALANLELQKRVEDQTSELRSAQAELLRSERLATLGQVSGGIAHEIRNPLNAVRTSVYFLRHAKHPAPEKIAEHLERIDRQVSMIDNVVTALADIARLPEPRPGICNLAEVVEDAFSSINLSGQCDVHFDLPEGDFKAGADPNQISIVFRNLIRNARDAMPDGGTITVTGCRNEEGVVVHVADTGPGIPPEELDRITEPLYSTKARGMGLGLAICVAILQKNRGRLEVKSRPGEGAKFSVHLPNGTEDANG